MIDVEVTGDRWSNCLKKSCILEHDKFGVVSVIAWVGISYDCSTDIYVVRNGSMTGVQYRDEMLAPIVRPYACAIVDIVGW
jgi:hypothetical protein